MRELIDVGAIALSIVVVTFGLCTIASFNAVGFALSIVSAAAISYLVNLTLED